MWFRNLLDSLLARPSRTPAQPRRRAPRVRQPLRSFRPHLEILEDRSLPSTFTVTNLLDTGPGSLREAVTAANANPGADVINFATTGTIALTSGELDITDSLSINGPGINSLTVSGNNSSRVFGLGGNPTVVIAGLTVANGLANGSPGGGIYDAGGTLTLDHVTLSGNEAYATDAAYQGVGGGLYVAGGVVYVNQSTLYGNAAVGGSSSYNSSGTPPSGGSAAGGGLYVAGGMVYVNQSTLSGNGAYGGTGNSANACSGISASDGGQAEGGGLYVSGGTVSIDNSTFSSNWASGGNGGSGDGCADAPSPMNSGVPGGNGGFAAGGAIRFVWGTVVVRHSTLSGNGVNGGAGGAGFIEFNAPPGGNGVGIGGGISGGLQMYDTILAGNTTSDVAPDLDGTLTSLGHNLIGNSAWGSGFAATDLLNVNPQLGALQNNGGPTQTMALLAGSPAINAGDNTGAPAFDQRGPGFARIVGGTIDIGAFEVQTAVAPQASSFAVSGFPASTTAGVAGSFTVTAKNLDGTTATGYTGTVHFSSSDGQAALPADYAFAATDGGMHTFNATLKTAGTQSLTATDPSGLTGSETGISVNPAAASKMAVSAPAGSTAGSPFSVTVTALDPYNNTATGYAGTVHFTSTDGVATLPGNYIFTAADAGMHVFTNGVILKTAGSQTVTATDTATAALTGRAAVTVSPAAASTLIVAGFPSPVTAGVASTFTVTAKDSYSNVATGYTGTIAFSSGDSRATLPGNYTFTVADAGVHTFSAMLKTAGTQSITAKDTVTGTITGTDAGITVNPAAASKFLISAPASVRSGVAFSLTITVKDAYGNVVTGYTGTIHFSSSDSRATLPANYTFTAADKGVHTFTGLVLRKKGNQKITLTDTLNSSLTGSVIENVV